ncbi:hypothetical protein ACF0H5_020195 [Mactra antiquata]
MEAIDDCCHYDANKVLIDITNVSPITTDVHVEIPFNNVDTYLRLNPGTRKTVDVDPSIQKGTTFKSSRGIRVSSNHSINVMVTNSFNSGDTVDSYTILPVRSVGKDYIISSFDNSGTDRGSEILVAGIYNNTNVTLIDGSIVLYNTILKPFDVFQYRKIGKDLTGLRILSDKDVYVVAGASFIRIPDHVSHYDYIASELYPADKLSTNYIVPPIVPKPHFMLRIIPDSAAMVTIRNDSNSVTINSTRTNVRDYYFGNMSVVITANQPIAVSQYGLSYLYDNSKGDPFMSIVPSVDQYVNDLKFSVPDYYYFGTTYMTIIVPKVYANDLRMDSNVLVNTTKGVSKINVPVPFDNYIILTFETTPGYHHIYHPSEDATFCVLVQGMGTDLGLGYYPGYNLNRECTKSKPSVQPSTPLPSTIQTTSSWIYNNTGNNSVQCYHCEGMTHLELCNTVRTCSKHEICFVERQNLFGRMVYRSGCMDQDVCSRQEGNSSDLCVQCCHGDYCNSKGCGENGLPDRNHRGPVCFDCPHVFSPEECSAVTMCGRYQVCGIEEFPWGDHSHFKLGCSNEMCDPLKRSILHRQDRSVPVCKACCNEDYCNTNCTINKNGPNIIIG